MIKGMVTWWDVMVIPTIKTPNIDRMASEGQRWTNFYVAANVCTPSRASLLTGRYGIRNGMYSASGKRRVAFSRFRRRTSLHRRNHCQALTTEWLSNRLHWQMAPGPFRRILPNNHGFDYYFGIPYSNDMDKNTPLEYYKAAFDPKVEYFNVPLMKDRKLLNVLLTRHHY